MNQDQQAFLAAAAKYELAKEQLDKTSKELQETLSKLEVNSYLQDPQSGLVYKIVVPSGTFVQYKALSYERTKKPDERSGTLSAKEATSKGFVLPGST